MIRKTTKNIINFNLLVNEDVNEAIKDKEKGVNKEKEENKEEEEEKEEDNFNEQSFKHSNWTLKELIEFKKTINSLDKNDEFYRTLNTIIDYKLDYPSDFKDHYKDYLYYQKQGIKKFFEKSLNKYTENKNKFPEIEKDILFEKLKKDNTQYMNEEEFKYIKDSFDIITTNIKTFNEKYTEKEINKFKDEVLELKEEIKQKKEKKKKEIINDIKSKKAEIIKEINELIDIKNNNSEYNETINKYIDEMNKLNDEKKLSLSKMIENLNKMQTTLNEKEIQKINNKINDISQIFEPKKENNFKDKIKVFEPKIDNNIKNKLNIFEPKKGNNIQKQKQIFEPKKENKIKGIMQIFEPKNNDNMKDKKVNKIPETKKKLKKLNFNESDIFEEDEKELRKKLSIFSKEISKEYQNTIISYINQAINYICKYNLYKTQILSLLCLINKNDKKGRIAQILTGEGKSKKVVALASYHVILGHCVDIVTSQKDLAKRDANDEKNKKIYEILGITVSHCISDDDDDNKDNNKKNCYDKNVIYGDTHNFQADFLYDKYHRSGVRNKRKCDIIIVDEIDSMFIDEYGKSTLLAQKKPFMSRLSFFLILMWLRFPKNNSVEDCINNKEEIEKNTEQFINKLYKNEHDFIHPPKIPEYLHEFAKQETKRLADSSLEAFIMNKDVKYQVKLNKDKVMVVTPIDNENTGNILNNTNLSHGLHQFLELKSKCKLTAMNLISSFLSNYGFFKLYRDEEVNNIYGLTGTLGSENAKDLLNSIYGLDFLYIPPARKRKLKQLTPIIDINKENWKKSIYETCKREIESQRIVLIICNSIKNVSTLESMFDKKEKVIKYKDDEDVKKTFLSNLSPGTIIIATNLAGRGTDIQLNEEAIKNGGLHVCLTFLPRNVRVQEQGFGRAGRKGEPGTCQLIINLEEVYNFGIEENEGKNLKEEVVEEMEKTKEALKLFWEDANTYIDLNSEKTEALDKDKEHIEDEEIKLEVKKNIFVTFEFKNFIPKFKEFADNYFNGLYEKFCYRYKELDERRNKIESDEIKQAKDRIDKIVKKDNFFLKYIQIIEKKAFIPDDEEFKDLEEQWGFFLSKLEDMKNDKEKDEAFEKFKINLEKDMGNMKNSGFICKKIQNLLNKCILNKEDNSTKENLKEKNKVDLNEENGKEILKLCNTDIEINKNNYSFATYYYRAIYYKLFEKGDKKNIEKAENDLKKAIEIVNEYKDSLMELLSALVYGSNEKEYEFLNGYIKNKILFLKNIIDGLLEPTLKHVKEVSKPIFKTTTLLKFFNLSIFNDYIEEMKLEGFNLIFVIYERISLISFGCHLFSGIMKMAFGTIALITLNLAPLLNGFKEILKSIENLWGHYDDFKFDIKDFLKEYKNCGKIKENLEEFENSINAKKKINRRFECNLDEILKKLTPKELEKISIETTKRATEKLKEHIKNIAHSKVQ